MTADGWAYLADLAVLSDPPGHVVCRAPRHVVCRAPRRAFPPHGCTAGWWASATNVRTVPVPSMLSRTTLTRGP